MSGASTTQSEPWTILRLLQWTTEHLKKSGSKSPRLDAEVLLAQARGCERIDLYTAFAEVPDEPVKAAFRELIRRRAQGEPVAYLVGKKEFYSLSFRVSPDCLIPRSETEHVVIECLDRVKKMNFDGRSVQIADVCTGSGCIAVSLAKHLNACSILAIDLSEPALAVAKYNVEQHKVTDIVRLQHGDLLDGVDDASLDFVLSNPPYVSNSEFDALDKSVRDNEPKMALVSGDIGTEIIERLAVQSISKLRSGGWFICELSPMIADQVASYLQGNASWTNVSLVKDLAGLKRIAVAQRC